MIKARVYLAGLSLAAASAVAHADLSVTPTVVSDYDFRGFSQTAEDPALQVGVDYGTGSLHIGAWASNIDFGPGADGHVELDVMADYTFGSDETAKLNVGVVGYTYPSMTDQNTVEFWATVSKSYFSGSIHYSDDWFTFGNAWYYEANGTFPIKDTGFSITGHIGYSSGNAWETIEYTDYGIGVTKSFGNFAFGLKFVASDAPESITDVFSTDDRVILSVSTTLPWAKE